MILDLKKLQAESSIPEFTLNLKQLFRSSLFQNHLSTQASYFPCFSRLSPLSSSSSQNFSHLVSLIKSTSNHKNKKVGPTFVINEQIKYKDYCNFVPIGRGCYGEELTWKREFEALQAKSETEDEREREWERDIRKEMEKGDWEKGFENIMKKYKPYMGFLNKIMLYGSVLLKGSSILEQYQRKLAILNILSGYSCYLKDIQPIRKNLSISLQKNEQITLQNIACTMKTLYCPLCFIYDCPIHESNCGKEFCHFASQKYIISKQEHLKNAIFMLDINSQRNCQKQKCSEFCYLRLLNQMKDKKNQFIFLNQLISMSDIQKQLVKMGIFLFSYNPCLISKIFPGKSVFCSTIYIYLQKQYKVEQKLNIKLFQSQRQLLQNQKTQYQDQFSNNLRFSTESLIDSGVANQKSRKKHKVSQFQSINPGQDFQYQKLSICSHFLLNSTSVSSSPQSPYNSVEFQCFSCSCHTRGYCLPSCLCSSSCKLRKKGCKCKKNNECCGSNNCPCFKNRWECIVEICGKNCQKENGACVNRQIQLRKIKLVKIGKSKIEGAGFGLFCKESVKKGQLVTIYASQKVDYFHMEVRDALRKNNNFYSFDRGKDQFDSKFLGNKSRFINHGNEKVANLQVRVVKSLGQNWFAFYSKRDIQVDQQLYFNYDGDGSIAKNHSQKYPFIIPK